MWQLRVSCAAQAKAYLTLLPYVSGRGTSIQRHPWIFQIAKKHEDHVTVHIRLRVS